MQSTSFWSDNAPRPPDLATTPLPATTTVAIIGSGYTALNAALALAAAGIDTTVVEQMTIGWGASSRNGGMINTGLKEDMQTIVKRYGATVGRQLWSWALASIDHVKETVASEAIDCDLIASGHAYLAYKPGHFTKFKESVDWYAANLDYRDMWVVGQDELHTEIGATGYHGAIIDSRAAGLHPAKYVFGLAQAAARKGVKLVEDTRVTAIAPVGERFRLTTTAGDITADKVLLATNGYTDNLVPVIRDGVFPVGSYIIVTEPLAPDVQHALSPRGRMFFDSKNFLNYFRLTPDGRMLFGGRHNLSPNLDVESSARMMRQRMVEVFPRLADIPLTHTWSGRLGLTFDLLPHAGQLASGPLQGLYYAYGYAGHGVSLASYLGYEMGQTMAEKQTPSMITQLKQQRYFFTKYDQLYLPFVSNWFRLLDRIS